MPHENWLCPSLDRRSEPGPPVLGFLMDMIDHLGKSGAGFQSLSDGIDTTTSSGRLVFHIMGALAEFERSLISERTTAGMKAAKRRGVHVGRRRKLSPDQLDVAAQLMKSRSQGEVAKALGVATSTLRESMKREGVKAAA